MPLVKRTRPQIGDVIEIPTPNGLAYAHYTHKHISPPKYGELIHVFPGLYKSRPKGFSDLVLQQPQFTTFFPLGAAFNRGIVYVVANEPIPPHAKVFPIFRSRLKTPKGSGPWWLWDGKRKWRIGTEADMESYRILSIWNDTLLVKRIIEGWRHEYDT